MGEQRWSVRLIRLAALLAVGGAVLFVARDQWRDAIQAARDLPALLRVERFEDEIRIAAEESRVDPCLLAAIMFAESGGRLGARSAKGALGLFQLMPVTARERARVLGLASPSEEDLLSDPLLNARLGADYLSWLLDRSDGNVERALVAYNTGPTRLSRWIREAGSYEAWREARARSGGSAILAYAAKVERYRSRFERRGLFESKEEEEEDEGSDS